VLGLVALVVLVFLAALDARLVFFERDIGNYWYPQVEALVRAVGEGAWPVWSPRFGFGGPLWADPGYQIAYPFTWLNLLLLPPTYYKVFVIAHCVIAVSGAYLFLRRSALAPFACFAGAAASCLSGPFLSATNLNHHFAGATWIPWALFALHGVLVGRGIGTALGVVGAVMILAGSGDVVLMTAILGAAYTIAFLVAEVAPPVPAIPPRRLARAVALAAVVAAGLSAALWVPTVAQLRAGSRLALAPADNMYWSMHPASLIDLVVPRLVADMPLAPAAKETLYQGREPFLATLYLGLPAVALALLAAVHPSRRLRVFAAASFAFFVLLALGRHTPLLPALLHLKPISLFRYPVKYMWGASIAWGVLVALGIDAWLRPWGQREWRYAVAVAGILLISGAALLFLAGRPEIPAHSMEALIKAGHEPAAREHIAFRLAGVAWMSVFSGVALAARALLQRAIAWTAIPLVALLVVNLVAIGRTVFLLAPRELLAVRPQLVDVISRHGAGRRVFSVTHPVDWMTMQMTRVPGGWPQEWAWFRGDHERLAAPVASRWGLAGSFDIDFTGLAPRGAVALAKREAEIGDARARTRLLQIGSVDYVVSLALPRAEGLREIAALQSVYTNPIRLYEVPDPLPKVYVVGRARPVEDGQAMETLLDSAFDPRAEAIVPADAAALAGNTGFAAALGALERRSDRVVLDVHANADALVVVTDAWTPQWEATVDGAEAPLLRANVAFRAVRVPAGRHRVEMRCRPTAILLGLALSAVTMLLLAIAWVVRRRREAARG